MSCSFFFFFSLHCERLCMIVRPFLFVCAVRVETTIEPWPFQIYSFSFFLSSFRGARNQAFFFCVLFFHLPCHEHSGGSQQQLTVSEGCFFFFCFHEQLIATAKEPLLFFVYLFICTNAEGWPSVSGLLFWLDEDTYPSCRPFVIKIIDSISPAVSCCRARCCLLYFCHTTEDN